MLLSIAWTKTVDESLATIVAQRFFENMNKSSGVVQSIKGYLSFDSPEPDFYIVAFEPIGFVLVAADDRSQPILAFSSDSAFPHDDIPESIEYFLSAYSKGMSEVRRHPQWSKDPNWEKIASMNFAHYESRSGVEPMIQTLWSQRWPYHILCPEDPGSPGGRVRVGTMATAMGQIMKKWNYPHRGQGSNSYNASGYGEQSANFGATVYNWQDMPDSVSTENLSVATLLYHCGVAVNMRYGTDFSIADTDDARDALVNHFRYHEDAEHLIYAGFEGGMDAWRNRLREELDMGRPLIYHAISYVRNDGFIFDGYQSDYYFHINWGWGGDRNGYYLLDRINPGTANYFTDYEAIVNIYPLSHPENDLAAVTLSGNDFPNMGEHNSYQLRVANCGLEAQTDYLVQLFLEDGTLIDQIAGEPILPQEFIQYDLNWTPDAQGKYNIYAKVQMSSDQNQENDRSNDLIVNVLGDDNLLIEIGSSNSNFFNHSHEYPSPYSSQGRHFRQHYLVLNSELSLAGAGAGALDAICFKVKNLNFCVPMINYRINLKHTDLNSLSTTFEPGDYQTVCQYDEFMPAIGWNTHHFDEPFIWDGLSNIIVEIITDPIVENPGEHASVYYTPTSYNSSLSRIDYDPNPNVTTGIVSAKRANMKLHYNSHTTGTGLLVNPYTIDFGDLIFGDTYGPRYINLANISGDTITISDDDFSLIGSDQFAFDSSLFPIVLEPTGTLAFPVTITGTEEGIANATIRFNCEGEEHEVALSANIWAEGLTIIGDGSDFEPLPINRNSWSSYAQMVYKPHEIQIAGKKLEKLAYHYKNTGANTSSGLWSIYVGHTEINGFRQFMEWVDTGTQVQVFHGSVELPPGDDWLEIDLDLHFIYNGEDNLVITVRKIAEFEGPGNSIVNFYNSPYNGWISMHHQHPESYEPLPSTGTLSAFRPNTKMYFGEVPAEPTLSYLPESIDFGNVIYGNPIGPKNVVVMNQGGGSISLSANDVHFTGAQADMFSFDEAVFPVSLEGGESFVIPVSVLGTQEGAISATLVINYGGEEHEVELSAYIWEENLVYIGDGSSNFGIPVMVNHDYSYSQFLYMPHEIMFARRQIEKIAFHWNGGVEALNSNSWNIYMGHTNGLTIPWGGGWIPLDELSQVYQGSLSLPAQEMWIDIELDTPFIYDGTSSLVIAIHETQPGSDGVAGYFYNTESRTYRGIHYTDGASLIDPANPANGTPKLGYPNIKMRFGDPSQDPVYSLSPDIQEWDFGLNPIYFDSKKEFTIKNLAGGTLLIESITVSGDGFTLEGDFAPIGLGCLDSTVFSVVHYPETVGDQQGTLTIVSNLGSYEIELFGSCYDPIIYDFPFFEGFEEGNIDGSENIANWRQEFFGVPKEKLWIANSSQSSEYRGARSGSWNLVLENNSDVVLVRPIMLERGHCYSLSFWARQNSSENARVAAYFGENYRMKGEPIQILQNRPVLSGNYQEYYCEFTAPETGLFFIGIEGYVVSGANYLSLDDISIHHLGEVLPPANLAAMVSHTQVTLSWDAPTAELPALALDSAHDMGFMSDAKTRQGLVLTGYRIYRDEYWIAIIDDPDITCFTDKFLANGDYEYRVYSVYNHGISLPVSIGVSIDVAPLQGSFEDGFEDYPDFATEFAPWGQKDGARLITIELDGIDFPGSGSKPAFKIFNPSQTTPPLTDIAAYEGEKMVATFSSTYSYSNDYLVTPRIHLEANSMVKFYARSHSEDYGLGHFLLGLYNSPAPFAVEFHLISGSEHLAVPASWTEYCFDLSRFDNQDVYLALHCTAPHSYILYIDNFSIGTDLTSIEDEITPAVKLTKLKGNYPNPFNPETTISYSLAEAGHTRLDIYNLKGQLVRHLVSSQMMAGDHEVVWNGHDDHNRAVSSGVYLIRLSTGKHISTKKMIMMK